MSRTAAAARTTRASRPGILAAPLLYHAIQITGARDPVRRDVAHGDIEFLPNRPELPKVRHKILSKPFPVLKAKPFEFPSNHSNWAFVHKIQHAKKGGRHARAQGAFPRVRFLSEKVPATNDGDKWCRLVAEAPTTTTPAPRKISRPRPRLPGGRGRGCPPERAPP